MEIQVKKAIKAGNSSAVILPRAWLNKEVRIELVAKTSEIILKEVLDIAKNHIELSEIIGIYLVGSYARKEEDSSSDIDILIISDDSDKEIIKYGIYNILIISKELLKQKLNQDLLPIGQMIKEAKPLLNSNYINSIKVSVTKRNVKWYIKTTEDKLKIIRKSIDLAKKRNKKSISDYVVYTLVLRIRTLYIISTLIKNKSYLRKDFVKTIKDISGSGRAYERYISVKSNNAEGPEISLDEAEKLYEYLSRQLEEVREMLKNRA